MSRYRTQDQTIEARALRRVRRKMGFFIHAFVFLVVNTGLFLLNGAVGGGHWHLFPLGGWGLGLAIHGLVVFMSLQGDGLRQRMLQSEIDRLRSQA